MICYNAILVPTLYKLHNHLQIRYLFLLDFKQTLKTSKKVVLLPSFFILTVAILLLSVVILPTQAQNQGGNFTTF